MFQEHCYSPVDNHTRNRYHLQCWNSIPSHITADLILPLRWTDGPLNGDLHSTQQKLPVQNSIILTPFQPQVTIHLYHAHFMLSVILCFWWQCAGTQVKSRLQCYDSECVCVCVRVMHLTLTVFMCVGYCVCKDSDITFYFIPCLS